MSTRLTWRPTRLPAGVHPVGVFTGQFFGTLVIKDRDVALPVGTEGFDTPISGPLPIFKNCPVFRNFPSDSCSCRRLAST